jgi:multidrug resistance efflux pump
LLNAEIRLKQIQAGPSAAGVASARASVAEARGELKRLEALPEPDAVAQAQAEFERATVILRQAQSAYDQIRDYPDAAMRPQALELQQATIGYEVAQAALNQARRKATPAQLEAARARLASAQAALERVEAGPSADELALAELQRRQAQAALDDLSAGPDPVEVKQATATVQTAKLALDNARANVAAATLAAPFDGVVLEVAAWPGETVMAGAALIRLADPSALEVRVSVIEEDLPLVKVGQSADLFFDARPDATVQGRVARIIPQRPMAQPGSGSGRADRSRSARCR